MRKTDLNGTWQLTGGGMSCSGTIPGSVYSFLLANNLMENPHYRMNELKALKMMEEEFVFSRNFTFEPTGDSVLLCCEGLDTLCDIYLNGVHVAYTDNMHRTYEFDVTKLLVPGNNEIRIEFHPSDAYIKQKNQEHPIPGALDAMVGFGHLRKTHCMFGWDWGVSHS